MTENGNTLEEPSSLPQTSRLIWQELQHQKLFGLLDRLASSEDIAIVLNELHSYAEEHFAIEEAYMRQLSFPETEAHLRAHDKFRHQLAELENNTEHGDSTREITAMFLKEWLTRHIYGTDQVLEDFIVNSGAK